MLVFICDLCFYLHQVIYEFVILGSSMIDKIVMHIPVDMSLVDVREDGKYCIFGVDLFDVGIKVESRSCYKDEDGVIQFRVLNHPFSKLPTSFTEMAFKFYHEGIHIPYVELKCSPAKILQGHNVYGSDWIEQGALEMLGYLAETYPVLYGMLAVSETEVKHLDVTYFARLQDERQVTKAIEFLRNLSTKYVGKSEKQVIHKNTVYFGAARAKRFARKIYGKHCEFMDQLEEMKELAKKNDKNAQRVVAVMSDPNLQEFSKGLLRFETGVKAYALRELNIPTNLFQLIRYQRENPYFLRNLWVQANREIFKALEGQTMKVTDHDSIFNEIVNKLQKVSEQDTVNSVRADKIFQFYQFLENKGHAEAKNKYEHQYFKFIADLLECGFTEHYIKNISVNPDHNLDQMTAYIIVFHRFKKVVKGSKVSLVQARNLLDFYKDIQELGYETMSKRYGKSQFNNLVNKLKTCGFSKLTLQNLHVQSTNNIIPFIKYVEINFDQQVPDNFVEPISTFNQRELRIA
nr:hypothetical protein F987_00512 [Acinetobacter gyllenbergii NIPH 230]